LPAVTAPVIVNNDEIKKASDAAVEAKKKEALAKLELEAKLKEAEAKKKADDEVKAATEKL